MQVFNHAKTLQGKGAPRASRDFLNSKKGKLVSFHLLAWGVIQLRHCLSYEPGSSRLLLVSVVKEAGSYLQIGRPFCRQAWPKGMGIAFRITDYI